MGIGSFWPLKQFYALVFLSYIHIHTQRDSISKRSLMENRMAFSFPFKKQSQPVLVSVYSTHYTRVCVCVWGTDAVIFTQDHGILSLSVSTAAEILPSVISNQWRAAYMFTGSHTKMTCLFLSHSHTHTSVTLTLTQQSKLQHHMPLFPLLMEMSYEQTQ